ncbi:hypothetical protein Fot_50706 [Forsythia ovata]|uniref:GRPD C-terminal domain-containing protein n=1 Tax=Forsythia ovata TaxID=205694 RepID=A0ABD1PYW5_9LAMI
MSRSDGNSSMRSLSEISEEETVRFGLDLVAAAKRNLGFLKLVNDSQWLHQKPTILEAIRRYNQLWMPLFADLISGSKPPMILPPLDIEWVWYCHTLNPTSYKHYCESRFSKLIGKPTIFDEENEEYALNRCREIWEHRFPSEPFENEADTNSENQPVFAQDLMDEVSKHRYLYTKFSQPYNSDMAYLIASKQRYKGFLYTMHRFANECSRLVPTSDVLLMWLTHESYPTIYAMDIKELEGDIEKIVGPWEAVEEEDIEETKMLWERTFDQPYDKAGGASIRSTVSIETPFYWEVSDIDVNTRYKSMVPRFLFELCVSVKLNSKMKQVQGNFSRDFLRLRMVKCHRELKLDEPVSKFTSESWKKAWHLYCEFGTKGMILELRQQANHCFKGSTLQHSVKYTWNDLLRALSLTSDKEVDQRLRAVASITPPMQASYLLKCVPDRVTDDSGAMISDVILRMNQYRPQEGRWLSRTVLDHAGRECFVIRMRVGGGFWRRGGEAPSTVKWEDRIIEIREGSWSYVSSSSSIGHAPEKVVGTATPKEPPEGCQASWSLSTGDELLIQWDPSMSTSGPTFYLLNEQSTESVKLLKGRQLQYRVTKSGLKAEEGKEGCVEEDDFVTIVRSSEENPTGKATALLNWKLLLVELLPEEDAVFVLLLCLSILRSISEIKKEDMGSLLVRRRIREAKVGERDWGSVILHHSLYSPSTSSPYLYPWYWNAELFMSSQVKDHIVNPPASNYSQAEGGDKLYERWIIS